MTADSVPAPMVLPRTPGSVVEATHRDQRGLWMLTPLRDWVMSDINNTAVLAATEGLTVHRVLFDAATPAASVPAADILALADQWGELRERSPNQAAAELRACAQELRQLVAAAEQADKGEGGQRGGKSQNTATPHDPPLTAPAAPPPPLCRCGHGPDMHHKNGTCFGAYARGCPCTQFDPFSAVMTTDADPRVPVNDEAEAAWQAYKAHPVPDDYRANRKSFLAGFRAARGEDA